MSAILALLVKGGPVMIPLAACSIVALAVILERAWAWRGLGRNAEPEAVLARAAGGQWDEACRLGQAARSPAARVLAAGIRHRNRPRPWPWKRWRARRSRGSSASCPCSTPSSRCRPCWDCSAP